MYRFIGYAVRAFRRAQTDPGRALARLRATRRWLHAADRQIERVLIVVERADGQRANRIPEAP